MANQKRCSKCDELKLTTQFSKFTNAKDGLQNYCKSCNKKINDKVNPKNYDKYLRADKNGIIYRIVNPLGETYIGCTKMKIEYRLTIHKSTYHYEKANGYTTFPKLHKSFDIWGIDAHVFELVKDCGDISKKELRVIESNMIIALKKNGKSLNINN